MSARLRPVQITNNRLGNNALYQQFFGICILIILGIDDIFGNFFTFLWIDQKGPDRPNKLVIARNDRNRLEPESCLSGINKQPSTSVFKSTTRVIVKGYGRSTQISHLHT